MSSPSSSRSKLTAPPHPKIAPFSVNFTDPRIAVARKIYLKIVFGGCIAVIIAVLAFFSIFWGALWKTPAHKFPAWVVVSLIRISFRSS
jgi:hypothetical protein